MSLLANAPQLQDVIAGYLSSADARPDVARKLGEVQARLVRVGTIETELQGLRRVRADLQNRTQELRSNLGAIRAGSVNESLRRTLTERLETAERELDRISGRLVESQEEQSRLRIEASELLSEITLQPEP
jgi:chromosome segregation ATPase